MDNDGRYVVNGNERGNGMKWNYWIGTIENESIAAPQFETGGTNRTNNAISAWQEATNREKHESIGGWMLVRVEFPAYDHHRYLSVG